MSNIDTILYLDPTLINEVDDRYHTMRVPDAGPKGVTQYTNWDDPKLWSNTAFGRNIQSELSGIGDGFSVEVSDFNKWVVVKVSHHNYITGRTSSKTFLIVFSSKSDGLVLSTANKWRSISGYSQAVQYIKSASQSLKLSTSNKL